MSESQQGPEKLVTSLVESAIDGSFVNSGRKVNGELSRKTSTIS